MQSLLNEARKDSAIHAEALEIFEASLQTEQDPWTAMSAAWGVEHIAGPEEGRRVWLALLGHPRMAMAERVALSIDDPFYVPALLDVLQRRPELRVRIAAIRSLGRLRDVRAFAKIVECLAVPEFRSDAIQALGDLGDPHAIGHLEMLRGDDTQLCQQDERGATLRVGDLAAVAIRQLCPLVELNSAAGIGPTPPEIPAGMPPVPRSFNPVTIVPLVAAVFELPWILAIAIAQHSANPNSTPSQTHRLDLIGMIPACIGLYIGVMVCVRRRPSRWVERIFLLVGCLACAFFIAILGHEMLN